MNIWEHPYPEDFDATLAEARQVAEELMEKLNEAPRLKDLFELRNARNYRKKKFFELLGVSTEHLTKKELSGIYLFANKSGDSNTPVYVGMSRTVARRLRQHGWGTGHNQPSLAYLMARFYEHKGSRSSISPEVMLKYKKMVREFQVSVVPEQDYFRLHFFETAVAGILKTKWNKFQTH